MMGGSRKARERGQATVELAVVFPVVIVIAVVGVNALLFFSDCAAFDRLGRQAVQVNATSAAYGQGLSQRQAAVQGALDQSFGRDNLEAAVAVEGSAGGHTAFTLTLRYAPTLFGLGLKSSVFGVQLPRLTHSVRYVVDCYKPGVVV